MTDNTPEVTPKAKRRGRVNEPRPVLVTYKWVRYKARGPRLALCRPIMVVGSCLQPNPRLCGRIHISLRQVWDLRLPAVVRDDNDGYSSGIAPR